MTEQLKTLDDKIDAILLQLATLPSMAESVSRMHEILLGNGNHDSGLVVKFAKQSERC